MKKWKRCEQLKFIENLNKLTPMTDKTIEDRERLAKLKVNIKSTEITNANRILQQHLSDANDSKVYAIGRTIKEKLGFKQNRKNR